jgi:leucyl-tRNA synthetase
MKFTTFTTRPDTIYGVTFLVFAPESDLVEKVTKQEYKKEVEEYIQKTKLKSDRERQINKEKTGVFTGSYAKHPLTGQEIPIWIADYVLADYGTGLIMAVPAHDQRDWEFAKKYNLEIKQVIFPEDAATWDLEKGPYLGVGILQNSGEFNGINSKEAMQKISESFVNKNIGKVKTNYKFRDWVFSRQRYWGEPFPFEYLKQEH